MKAFPIVTRELRVASRKWGTYWNRCLVALGAILVAVIATLILQQTVPKEAGIILFAWMSGLAYVHCLMIGLVLTADSLSEEKREGTLGLLFLTDLRGYDVVYGKMVANSLRGVYGLLAIFPVLGLCLLLGGVSAGDFQRVMVVCLNCLFLSLALGMLASAVCVDERKAIILSFLIILLLTAGLPALGAWIGHDMRSRELSPIFLVPSPGFSCFAAFDSVYRPHPRWFWCSVGVQNFMGWMALAWACRIVPRTWQDRIATPAAERRKDTMTQWSFGSTGIRAEFRRRLLEINPYYWLTSRERFKQTLPWVWLACIGLIWLLGLANAPTTWRDEGMYVCTALVLHTIFKVWVGFEASRRLGADRHTGALELLLCTPLDVRSMLRGQWMSLLRQFAAPVAIVFGADLIFLAAGSPARSDSREWLYLCLAGMSVFIADLIALAWLAMWLGLTARRSGQGGISAIVQICILPWLIFVVAMALLAILDLWHIVRVNGLGNFVFFLWWIISIVVDVFFGWNSYSRLHRELRVIASERRSGRAAAWGRALGLMYGRWRAEK